MGKNKNVIVVTLIALVSIFGLSILLTAFDSEPTEKFLSLINIEEDGSIRVRELIKLNGDYNGLERIVFAANSNASYATGTVKDVEGDSTLYNGDSIINVRAGAILDDGELTFDDFNNNINYFDEVSYASDGESGKYINYDSRSDTYLKLYNPSSLDEIFYIEYTVTNVVVVHDDIAEFAWNVLGNGYNENIDDFEVKVVLPNSDDDYRVWLHGPLNGNIERTTNKEAVGTFNFLGAYNPVSVRLIFNKTLVPYASKYSGFEAKDAIISYQTKLSEEANAERETINRTNTIMTIVSIIWIIVAILIAVVAYLKEKSTKKTNFNMEYFRDFPGDYGPYVLEYLLDVNVTEKSLSATILNLIYKKVLKVEKVESKKKADYKLVLQEYDENSLTDVEKIALNLIINEVGNSKEVILSSIKKHCSSLNNAKSFMNIYNNFIKTATKLGKKEGFYNTNSGMIVPTVILCILGILLLFVNFSLELSILASIIFVLIFILIIFVLTRRSYTKKGALHYAEWMAHKRFLEDFSRFDEKELPEVALWDKYLVYAVVLDCADKLSKEMEIKVASIDTNTSTVYMGYDPFLTHYLVTSSIYSSINNSVHTAIASSRSSIAASQRFSGTGFGGGSIGGGGSFGGGGGGGRF